MITFPAAQETIEKCLYHEFSYFEYRDHASSQVILNNVPFPLGLSNIIVLVIYHDILKVSISQYFVINYCDTMPVHYCHQKSICYVVLG